MESVVIQQSRVANMVIIVMLNEENLTQETGGWAETDQDLNLVNLQSWTSYIITHNASYSFLQWVYLSPTNTYSIIYVGKIFPASRQEKPVEITQDHKGTMKDQNIRGRCPYLAHQWLKFQPNEGEEDLRSVQ